MKFPQLPLKLLFTGDMGLEKYMKYCLVGTPNQSLTDEYDISNYS